jgi:hypothetical protein
MTPEEDDILYPLQLTDNEIITPYFCYTTIFDAKETSGKIYTDQTGPFPYQSSTGNYLLLLFYDYDTNAILAEKQLHYLRLLKNYIYY